MFRLILSFLVFFSSAAYSKRQLTYTVKKWYLGGDWILNIRVSFINNCYLSWCSICKVFNRIYLNHAMFKCNKSAIKWVLTLLTDYHIKVTLSIARSPWDQGKNLRDQEFELSRVLNFLGWLVLKFVICYNKAINLVPDSAWLCFKNNFLFYVKYMFMNTYLDVLNNK